MVKDCFRPVKPCDYAPTRSPPPHPHGILTMLLFTLLFKCTAAFSPVPCRAQKDRLRNLARGSTSAADGCSDEPIPVYQLTSSVPFSLCLSRTVQHNVNDTKKLSMQGWRTPGVPPPSSLCLRVDVRMRNGQCKVAVAGFKLQIQYHVGRTRWLRWRTAEKN